MSYIGADDLVYNNDIERGIHSGGFSVKSLMMKEGISPIMTINKNQIGGTNQVSDIFNDLVVPNWALSYHNKMAGGTTKNKHNDSDSEDDVIDDDLHDRLLDLVKQHDIQMKENKKKKTRKNLINKKKGGTKRTK
jgi:hypothetical protein